MNSFVDNINSDIDIHQKRAPHQNPKDIKINFITNIFVYCGFHYPFTKPLIDKLIIKLIPNNLILVQTALFHLFECFKRQVISGPSSSFCPPSQISQIHKKDISLEIYQNDRAQLLNQFIKANEQLGFKDIFSQKRVNQLTWYNCSQFLSTKSVQASQGNYKFYRHQLQLDGQSWLQSTPYSYMFCFMIYLLQKILQVELPDAIQKNLRLLFARMAYLHNKHLKNPVKKLSEVVLTNYKKVIQIMIKKTTLEDYIQILLEYSFCLLFYYKYKPCQQILRQCSSLVSMKIQFTGKLGRRTKYQQFDTPQLVMNLIQNDKSSQEEQPKIQQQYEQYEKQQNDGKLQFIDPKLLIAKQRGIQSEYSNQIIKSTYDEESILLQTPKFVQQNNQNEKQIKQVHQYHLLISLAILHYQYRSTPHDQMLYQNITAAIMTLLKYQVKTTFSYNFSILLLRSLNQFPRIKHCQRALDQLQKLKSVYNAQTNKNVSNLFATPYQTYLSYILVLASKYMDMGLSLTAINIFQEAKLYEQCIDGLIMKNYKEKALELINKLIDEKGKSPRLLCMLGDLYKDEIKYYYEAWDLSKQTSARAMRSLGWYYYGKNDFEKAAQSFYNATTASYYHPSTWFTLGCSYMNLKQFDKALKAFSQCISIDQTQGQAWGNMASCYMHTKRLRQACTTLQQAVKYSESNWKLWANLITVSLSVKKFYKYFQSIQKVVKLGHQQTLSDQIMKNIIKIMQYKNESQQRKRIIYNYKRRIDNLYIFLQEKIGENPLLWKSRTQYQIEMCEYYDIMNIHYLNLHLKNMIDLNDLVPGYQTKQSTLLMFHQNIKQTKRKIVQYKQNQMNMTMIVGWNQNKLSTEKVKKILIEYVQIYKMYSDKSDKEDFRLFINGISQKISFCLQVAFEVDLSWLV